MSRMWLLLCLGWLLGGCATRLLPPEGFEEPRTAYLLDHGRHASLVLPDEVGLVRYSYGERRWYLLGRQGPLEAVAALLWPTPAVLGRGFHPGARLPDDLAMVAPEGVVHVYPLAVEARRVRALSRYLDGYFTDARGRFSPRFALDFVPHPRPYWAGHQSNRVVASWLRVLGWRVEGPAWLSDWRVAVGD